MNVQVQTLGRVDVLVDGENAGWVGRRRLRTALLVHLAVERTATRSRLVALLWPDRDERSARHSLSQVLHELTKALGPDWNEAQGDRLQVAEWIEADAAEFLASLERGEDDDALPLYGGPFLDGVHLRDSIEWEWWVDGWRQRLRRLYREACHEVVGRRLAEGDAPGAIATARRCAEEEPLDAEIQALLLRALIEDGRAAAAVRQYERYERRLRAVDLTPPEELADLIADVRNRVEPRVPSAEILPRPSRRATGASVPRLVVLPFEHLGPRDAAFFTEGVTDEITNRLARLPGLAVIARTSANQYRDTTKTIDEIRHELAVDYLIEGTVRWDRSGSEERVRISPQLIRGADSTHLWAEICETPATDAFRVQTRVAEMVAVEVDSRLGCTEGRAGASSAQASPRDPDAHELFVRGMRQWEERGEGALERAKDLFQRSIERDPAYASAYAGLAETYGMISSFTVTESMGWLSRAKAAAAKALELDPKCAECHVAAGMIAYMLDCDMEATERHLSEAIRLEPSHAVAHVGLAYAQCSTGRTSTAFETMARARALDPLSVSTNFDVAFQAWQGHDGDLAAKYFRLTVQLAPDFDPASYCLGGIYYLDGETEATKREWGRMTMFGPAWQTLVDILDDPVRALEVLDRAVKLAPGSIHWYGTASCCALLGGVDRAFTIIESHLRNLRGRPAPMVTSGPSLAHVSTDPFFDALRADPRYEDLVRRIGVGRAG